MDNFGFLQQFLDDSFDYGPENDPIFLTQRTPERPNVVDATHDDLSELLETMNSFQSESKDNVVSQDAAVGEDAMALVPVNSVEVYNPEVEDLSSEEDELVQKVCNSNYIQHVQWVDGKLKLHTADFSEYEKAYEEERKEFEREAKLKEARKRMLNDPELKWSQEQLEALKKKRDRIFGSPVPDVKLEEMCKKKNAGATDKNVRWVLKMYSAWRTQRNKLPGRDIIECDLEDISSITKESLIFAMCRFLCEVRKQDGSEFPPKSLRYIVIMTQCHLETLGIMWKLIDGPEFVKLHFCLDNRMKQNAKLGLGREVKSAEHLEVDDIEELWKKGLLGDSNPSQLQDTVLFLVGINCALRAAKEHKMLLRPGFDSQFQFIVADGQECIKYTEDLSTKSNQGGLKHVNVTAKKVTIYPAINKVRCPVRLIKLYLSLLPKTLKTREFYLQCCSPKQVLKTGYRDRPVGINTIVITVKRLAKDCGLDGYFTNHSLRHTCGTLLHNQTNKLPDQSIAERTGHRSNAIEKYKHSGKGLKRKVSRLLTDPSKATSSESNVQNEEVGENIKKVKLDITVNIKQ